MTLGESETQNRTGGAAVTSEQQSNETSGEKKRTKNRRPQSRRVVVRCGSCGKALGTFHVSRRAIALAANTAEWFRLEISNGDEFDGGDTVWCSRKDCGAGPRAFPEGTLWRMIGDAAKRGESSLTISLPTN
jgi:hypothetical protein